jgi:hypothetical protein
MPCASGSGTGAGAFSFLQEVRAKLNNVIQRICFIINLNLML